MRKKMEKFLLFCFGGWIYESIWCSLITQNRGFVNRGFFFGPWIPIYGFGMLFILLVVRKLKIKKWTFVFGTGIMISVICELIGSYIMEVTTGSFLWDYHDMFLNFQGRIALQPALYFGFLVLLANYMVLPWFEEKQKKYGDTIVWRACSLIYISLFLFDVLWHLLPIL